jgi:hypothetical protein
MTVIREGMTANEVVDILGPPLDTLSMEEFLSGRSFAGEPPAHVYWLYLDVPPGRESNIVLDENGVVVSATERPYDARDRPSAGNTWAKRAVAEQRAKVERQPTFAELVRLPGWQRLGGPDAVRFVVDTFATADNPTDLARRARRFGELDVFLSVGPHLDAAAIRAAYFADGYLPVLARFMEDFGIRPGQYDLAHWIFGHAPRRMRKSAWVAHLAYIPADGGITAVLPWELLSPGEQSRGSLSD